jgi:anion-transporting  ArsA/GET3 family ATPase
MNPEILNKRLVIVIGKGGVGKSVICAALALIAGRKGKKVLIIEVSSRGKICSLFGITEPDYNVRKLHDNIFSMSITPDEAMREYGLMKLKFRKAYHIVFENDFMKALFRVIPGMNELLLMGKVAFEEERRHKKNDRYEWDMIILDAPPTGHGLSLLKFPSVVLGLVPEGPMAVEMKKIKELLLDEKRTCLNIVTLPEEMPVIESYDLKKEVDECVKIPSGYLIVNGVIEDFFDPGEKDFLKKLFSGRSGDDSDIDAVKPALFLIMRREMQDKYIAKVKELFPDMKKIIVPFVPDAGDKFLNIEKISYYIERSL